MCCNSAHGYLGSISYVETIKTETSSMYHQFRITVLCTHRSRIPSLECISTYVCTYSVPNKHGGQHSMTHIMWKQPGKAKVCRNSAHRYQGSISYVGTWKHGKANAWHFIMVLGYLGSISYVGTWKHGKANANMERQTHGATVCIVLDISTYVYTYSVPNKHGGQNSTTHIM